MTIYLSLEDQIIKRANNDRIARNTRYITNVMLWGGLSILVVSGVIGIKILGDCLIVGCANKGTKMIIKKIKDVYVI